MPSRFNLLSTGRKQQQEFTKRKTQLKPLIIIDISFHCTCGCFLSLAILALWCFFCWSRRLLHRECNTRISLKYETFQLLKLEKHIYVLQVIMKKSLYGFSMCNIRVSYQWTCPRTWRAKNITRKTRGIWLYVLVLHQFSKQGRSMEFWSQLLSLLQYLLKTKNMNMSG